jgi:hypothetical protein
VNLKTRNDIGDSCALNWIDGCVQAHNQLIILRRPKI